MTIKQLDQIYYLTKEKQMWEDRLRELPDITAVRYDSIGVSNSGVSSPVQQIAEQREKIREIISAKLAEISFVEREILEYICSIDDSLMRQIMTHRHIELKSWLQVANAIGGNNTADSVRKMHDRFLQDNQ